MSARAPRWKAAASAEGRPRSARWAHTNTAMAASAPTVSSRVSPSLLNSSSEETRASAALTPCRVRCENAVSRAGGSRRPKPSLRAQLGWPRVAARRCDEGHRAGDGDDRRDPLGDRRVRRVGALMRPVDHHRVLTGGDTRDRALGLFDSALLGSKFESQAGPGARATDRLRQPRLDPGRCRSRARGLSAVTRLRAPRTWWTSPASFRLSGASASFPERYMFQQKLLPPSLRMGPRGVPNSTKLAARGTACSGARDRVAAVRLRGHHVDRPDGACPRRDRVENVKTTIDIFHMWRPGSEAHRSPLQVVVDAGVHRGGNQMVGWLGSISSKLIKQTDRFPFRVSGCSD